MSVSPQTSLHVARKALRKAKKIVVLEGLPGAGKSTIGRILAKAGWTYFQEVATEVALAGAQVAASENPFLDVLILAGEVRREERMRQSPGNLIVVESSHLSNLAWAKTRAEFLHTQGYKTYLAYFKFACSTGEILRPTTYVRLEIPPELSAKRYFLQGSVKVPSLEFLSHVTKNLDALHRRFEPDVPFFGIDASQPLRKTVAEVEDAIN